MYSITLAHPANEVKQIEADRATKPDGTETWFFRKGKETVAMVPASNVLFIEVLED